MTCPFCDPVNHVAVWMQWTDRVYVARPLFPVTQGHLLVIPNLHVETAFTDPTLTGEVFKVACDIAYNEDACNLITSVGAAATQTIMHLHVHIVPRRVGDGLHLPWTEQ